MQQKDNKTINNHNKRSKEREEGEIDLSLTELPFSIVSDLLESWLPETEKVATVEAISTPAIFPVGMKHVNFYKFAEHDRAQFMRACKHNRTPADSGGCRHRGGRAVCFASIVACRLERTCCMFLRACSAE